MAWKEQEWGLCWCSGQSSNKRNTEELLWQWNFSLFRFQPPLINFSKVCEERRVEHRALLCALTAAELLSKAIFSSLQLPAQGEQGCHLPLNIPALLSAQPHLNLGLKRTLRRFKVRWDSDLFHPQGHSSGPSDLLPVAGAGWHLPFHRVYNGTQSLCCFIFPFPHGFLLQFPIPSSSSFLSIHSRPLSPFYSRDNEPDVKFPSSAITSSLWSLKPAEWVWQSWAEGHRVQSRGWVWVWSSITTSSEIAGMSWVRALGSYPGNWGRLTPVLLLFHPTFICEQSHNPLTPSPLAAQPNSGMNFHPQETWFCFHQFYPALSLLPSCRKQCLTGSTASSNFQEGRNDLYQLGIEPDYV